MSGLVLWGTLGCETESSRLDNSPSNALAANANSVEDLDGSPIDPISENENHVRALIFSRTDCPIARRYAPEIRRLCEKFSTSEVKFYLVFPNSRRSGKDIRQHLNEFDYPCDAVRDPDHILVSATGVKITPEAAVYDLEGELAYVGRIDDRFPKFGVAREPTTHELEDAILAALGDGEMPVADGPAIGCYISDLKQ